MILSNHDYRLLTIHISEVITLLFSQLAFIHKQKKKKIHTIIHMDYAIIIGVLDNLTSTCLLEVETMGYQ
jgi:hypothetical protein